MSYTKTKYIISKVGDKYMPIIFPNQVPHRRMAYWGADAVVSAGFIWRMDDGSFRVNGDSESLTTMCRRKITSRAEDVEILNQFFNFDKE